MMAKPIWSLELQYPMIQLILIIIIPENSDLL